MPNVKTGAFPVFQLVKQGEYGVDTTGADAYATIITPTDDYTRISIDVETNDVIISVDGGTTDNLYVKAGTMLALDGYDIERGIAIKAKNGSAGNNYANLVINVW